MDWIKIINEIYNREDLSASERYFLFSQINAIMFHQYKDSREEIDPLMFKLYSKVCQQFEDEIDETCELITDRNQNLVIILTSQFLHPLHAPTRIVLDIASYISSQGKQAFIINSAECLGDITPDVITKNIPFPIEEILYPKYITDYCDLETFEHNGRTYPFFQFDNNMPSVPTIKMFLNTIRKIKPSYIINISGASPLADACSKLIPTICYPTGNSVCYSQAQVQYLGRPYTEYDDRLLSYINKGRQNVITGPSLSVFDDSGKSLNRLDLGIDSNAFLLAVVGNRLYSELDHSFLSILNSIVSDRVEVLFIGDFSNSDELMPSYENLSKHSHFISFAEDLPATLSACDLFVNPIRSGGGTGAVMAMKRGIPVLTTSYGDIAYLAGSDFSVDSIESYPDIIERYNNDLDFYKSMSEKASNRAIELTDSHRLYSYMLAQFHNIIETL